MKREGSRKYYAQTKLLISTLYEFLQVPSGNQGPGGDDDQCDFLGLRHGDHCGAGSGAPGYLYASLHQRGKTPPCGESNKADICWIWHEACFYS